MTNTEREELKARIVATGRFSKVSLIHGDRRDCVRLLDPAGRGDATFEGDSVEDVLAKAALYAGVAVAVTPPPEPVIEAEDASEPVEDVPVAPDAPIEGEPAPEPDPPDESTEADPREVTPAARARAAELDITIELVAGTGRGGRVTLADVEKYNEKYPPSGRG